MYRYPTSVDRKPLVLNRSRRDRPLRSVAPTVRTRAEKFLTAEGREGAAVPCGGSVDRIGDVTFRGWPAEALDFYEGLEADNSKTYWTEHRHVFDNVVRAPMDALLAELEPEFGKGKVFRPYRDVRFSADKTPYKTHLGAVLDRNGYIQLSAHGLGVGSGAWQLSPEQLERYRRAVADERTGAELERVIATLERKGIGIHGHGVLKTVPRGYPRDHPRAERLRYKGLTAWREWQPAAWLGTANAKRRIVEFLHDSRPLVDWLRTNAGTGDAPSAVD
jgi:uncharacterized protein (TIGR02453 family)